MELRIKNSSVKTAPNGRTPPIKDVIKGLVNHGCFGTCRGMAFVLTGSSIVSLRNPMYAPTKTNGTEMPNQSNSRENIVVKGTAPELPVYHINRFTIKKTIKTTPGNQNMWLLSGTSHICHWDQASSSHPQNLRAWRSMQFWSCLSSHFHILCSR